MNKIYGKIEALMLLLCGAAILWFAFSDRYGLLMNPKFKGLTITGAAFLLILGVVALPVSRRRSPLNISVFGAMILIVIFGKPYLPDASSMLGMEPEPAEALMAEIDLEQFPREQFQYLLMEAKQRADSGKGFTIVGTAKRLDELDRHGSFALMTSTMYCCLADVFASGYRIAHADWADIEDGQPLLVSGTFAPEPLDLSIPNFRFGRAMFSTVDNQLIISPERLIAYNRLDELPTLAELLDEQSAELFVRELKGAGLWQQLAADGPFTVFLPADKAMELVKEQQSISRTSAGWKQFLQRHVVTGKFFTSDLVNMDKVASVNGENLNVELENGTLLIEGSRLLFKNVEARNGVVHYIYPALLKDTTDQREGNGSE